MGGSRWRGGRSATKKRTVAGTALLVLCVLLVPACVLLLSVFAVALVSGPHEPAPPPATSAQLRSVMERYIAERVTGARPPSTTAAASDPLRFIRFVDDDEWADVMNGCVRGRGVDDVTFGPGYAIDWRAASHNDFAEQVAAVRHCRWAYPSESMREKLMSEQEAGFLYDYYQTELAPCLRMLGRGPITLPKREVFIAAATLSLFVWSPYDRFTLDAVNEHGGLTLTMIEDQRRRYVPAELLRSRCPETPHFGDAG